MGTILKLAAFTGCLAFAFYVGYEMGSHLEDADQRIDTLKRELSAKMGTLDREMRSLKERATLAEARDAVERARKAVDDKHFGDAEAELNRAAESLQRLESDAREESKSALASIRGILTEMKGRIHSLGRRAQEQLWQVERHIDELAQQWDAE